MSRSGYSDDYGDDLAHGRWRGQVTSAIRGKRGQEFLQELLLALESLPEKRLITNHLRKDGEVCAMGAIGVKRNVQLESYDVEDAEGIADQFGIAHQLVREIEYLNDEGGPDESYKETPEDRWLRMYLWIKSQIKKVEKR